jgi:chemotaxis protein MotB
MAKEKKQIIIVKKVKKGHGGHHGGSWKVAYADFVTAMMAFFMVMWILGMDESVRAGIEGYFQNPVGVQQGFAAGMSPVAIGSTPAAVNTPPLLIATRQFEQQRFREIAERLQARLDGPDGLGALADQVEIVITDQGLRIELVEGGDGEIFFAFGSFALKPAAERALRLIASELGTVATPVVVEGHTDAARFGSGAYTNWELSADRANAARRTLERTGLGDHRVSEIRGHADRHLRNSADPFDKANRRISVLLPFTTPAAEISSPLEAGAAAKQ